MTAPQPNPTGLLGQESLPPATPSPGLNAVSIKIPPFWPADPILWFANIEAQFILRGVTTQLTKFYHVVGALGPNEAAEVRDIITVPPADHPYDALKTALTRRTTASEQERLRQLLTAEVLGDRRPSQLLRRMQQLLGDRASALDDSILRELFLQRLPNTVRMILTTSTAVSLEALAEMADKIMDIAPPTISAVSSQPHAVSPLSATPTMSDFQILRDEVARLTDMVSTLRFNRRSTTPRHRSPRRSSRRRSPSNRSPSPNPGECWYHQTFGASARNCRPPCTYPGNGAVSN
ncbi:uncharacterized protein LOC135384759 [Ornithodoros turicata]|uniref:uncharacterized protein LOC135384759 n=1 Tax=Ornithodoros turicata TaxID=34597 RepID=UPI003139E907